MTDINMLKTFTNLQFYDSCISLFYLLITRIFTGENTTVHLIVSVYLRRRSKLETKGLAEGAVELPRISLPCLC